MRPKVVLQMPLISYYMYIHLLSNWQAQLRRWRLTGRQCSTIAVGPRLKTIRSSANLFHLHGANLSCRIDCAFELRRIRPLVSADYMTFKGGSVQRLQFRDGEKENERPDAEPLHSAPAQNRF
jgi:hypothetical protein